MQGLMLRIDDRLIHGQVVVGWGSDTAIDEIVVGNDGIAESDWETEMLQMAAGEVATNVVSVMEATEYINSHLNDENYRIVLTESILDVEKMCQAGLALKKINIGGIHCEAERTEYLPYVFLTDQEVKTLKRLIAEGFEFYCQDVPTGKKYLLSELI